MEITFVNYIGRLFLYSNYIQIIFIFYSYLNGIIIALGVQWKSIIYKVHERKVLIMSEKKIIIANDDGIECDGLRRLVKTAKKFGEVWVVAPDGQRSASSHIFSYNSTIKVWEYDYDVEGVHAFVCTGSAADCMRVGIQKIVPGKPDFAFAGINAGPNISSDIQYSGTLGAVFESEFLGIHSIAFSEKSPDNHELSDKYLEMLMKECMDKPLSVGQVWNVNFPDCSLAECKGILRDRKVSTDHFYDDDYVGTDIGNGVTEYKLVPNRIWEASEGTDLKAIIDNYISVGIVNNVG